MSLLNTSISESIDNDIIISSLSSSSNDNNDRSNGIKKRVKGKQVSEKNKVIAACSGAVVTSLTMTPFDVIKTRLQTQMPEEPLFRPSSHLPPPSLPSNSPWPIPIASTSKVPISTAQSSSSTAATNLATCCQKTYFSSNLADSLLCRFDPRTSTAALPSVKPKSISYPKQSSSLSIPRIHPSTIPPLPPTSTSTSTLTSSTLLTSNVCLYPNSASATIALPNNSAPSSTRHLTGFWDALVKIVRYEGLSAMWRGTGPALAMSVPGQVVYMVGYDWGRRTAFEFAPTWAYVPPQKVNTIGLRIEEKQLRSSYLTAVPLLAGGLSRTFVAAIVSPIELMRTRLQSSTTGTTIPAILKTLKADGLKSAWRGLPATLWRDVPFSGIYWAGYEGIKRTLTGGKGMGEGWEDVGVWEEFKIAFVSGAGSGMIAAVVTNPFDVVKTRRQALDWPTDSTSSSSSTINTRSPPKVTSTFPMILNIIKKEGWAGIMGGLTPRLAKVMPACGVMIAMYEGLGRYLD